MMKSIPQFLLPLIVFVTFLSVSQAQNPDISITDSVFKKNGVIGCFVSYDLKSAEIMINNSERSRLSFLPASTFKILNSLIALEIGLAKDEHFIIPYSGEPYNRQECNCDMEMIKAFQISCVPYYQEIARRIGYNTMVLYVNKAQYGVMDIKKSNLDDFWLKGGSRITPLQQLDFIRQLAAGTLLFSEHSQTVVRKMMLIDSTSTYQLRGKTGLSYQDGKSIGWLVGYLEKGDNIIAFVLNIEMEGDASPEFMRMRGEMVHEIFLSSGIISD